MAGCGYVCPLCEGRGFLENGAECDYCAPPKLPLTQLVLPDRERQDWISMVHEGSCCADRPE